MPQDNRSWPREMEEILRQIETSKQLNAERHEENKDKLNCLALEMRRFVRNYEDTLKTLKTQNEQWADVKKDLVKKGVTGALLWFIGIISVALWFYVKEHLK